MGKLLAAGWLTFGWLIASGPALSLEPTIVRHYDRGYSPLLRTYLRNVIEVALEKTVPEYGPYELQLYSTELSSNRANLETEKGDLIDISFSPDWRGKYVDRENVFQIEYPVFNDMLGLRSAVVTRETDRLLSQVEAKAEFTKYSAGQGASWVDVDILRANGIAVIEAQLFGALFPMLVKNRYDYLPLSILEAQSTLGQNSAAHANLTINNDIYVFYPLPFYLFVNAGRPQLAARLERGLQVATRDGTIDSMFAERFDYLQPILEASVKKLVVLENPALSQQRNREFTERFLGSYRQHFIVLE